AARETEWNQIRQDVKEKYLEWTESAAELLENGRADWNAGIKKMEEAYGRWITGFREEHNRVSEEWAEVYLAGLEDKEKWLEQVTAAANQASNESFLSLIGAEAERFSRVMDTREPFGIRNAAPEAETLMAELLQTSGISSMAGAFDSLNKNSGFISSVARRGMGGVSIWDASLARSAASDLARKNNAELADRESRKLARSAREAADEAVKNIAVNVDSANRDFRQNMDNTFIFQGLWRRNGNNYVKDIIMGSTLFQPVISETETVKGYTDYRMEPVTLKTNLDENYLAGLDSVVIMAMLENVFLEVETIVKEIFGTGEESKKIDQDRDQFPGKFGVYIGYVPAVKPPGGTGSSKSSMFYDQGSGELGRLMTEYFYWNLIDQMGSAEFSLAAWDKRMWDDRNSFFDAPTLRTTVKVTGAIAAAVVSAAATPLTGGASLAGVAGAALLVAGINSTGDLAFAGLDAAFGYKTIDEAAFEWGKASLINTATSLGSGFLGAAGSLVTGTMGAVTNAAFQTGMAGVQTATTTLITSAVNGITYSNENGLGYSGEIFKSGFTGIGANLLSSMSSAATMGTLQIINSGTIGEKLTGFSNLNRSDLAKLNGLAGSLTGQGINYAMGGDFTMNILNIGLFTDGKINSGLLELHLGRDGTSMSIGTGGANVSIENLAAAYRGTLVWNVNNRIDKYANNNEFDGKIALRAQYGFGDNTQTGQLWNILKGKDEIWLTGKEGDFAAETTIVDGKRIINLAGYESDMSVEEQMRLAVILGHEAYRDGIVTGDNYLETRQAVLAHTEMAMRMLIGGQSLAFDKNLEKDLIAYNVFGNAMGSLSLFNGYIDNNYDSSGDYWKLTKEGNLEYDGFATLRDADGNILRSYREMGLKNDNSVEGALLWLLSINQKDSTGVAAVRKMMERSGLKHSFDADPNNWMWKGEHMAITGNRGSFPTMGTLDLTRANMGKTININAIAKLFTTIGTSGTNINNSVNRIYGSSIGFLNYADTGGNTGIANSILLNYYTVPQLTMVQANQNWLNESLKNTVNINGMIRGNPERTGGFGETYDDIKLSSSSVAGASYFSEIHTGIDFGSGGTGIYAPGGNWQLINVDDHKAYYRLYGGDMTMRIQHLNPKTLSGLLPGTIYSGTADKLVDYPTASYGSGSGAHIHIDMTRWLPYNGSYTRQFVNPETLLAGNRLEYQYSYMDAAKVDLPGYPMNFYRY
ncbi:MAG: hypothetical protein LBG91_02915, partial [Treponema sp.]|nr:hypothetical protein [Treponema sp.]